MSQQNLNMSKPGNTKYIHIKLDKYFSDSSNNPSTRGRLQTPTNCLLLPS